MENDARERLWNITKRLVNVTYTAACDSSSTDKEFQTTVDALVHHLENVRRRARELSMEKQPV
jgi:hypothetical protein